MPLIARVSAGICVSSRRTGQNKLAGRKEDMLAGRDSMEER